MDHDNGTCLALLDLSAAFDTINHSNLLTYLTDYLSFDDNALNFMKSYLSDWTQCVQRLICIQPSCVEVNMA